MGAKGSKGKGGKRTKNQSSKSNGNVPTLRVLLLGSPGSGKSTFAKQMKHLNGDLTNDEYQTFRTIIHQNIIVCMQELLKQTEKQEDPVLGENHKLTCYVSEQVAPDATFDSSFANKVQTLYDDPAIQRVYAKCRYTHQSLINFDYFITHLDRIAHPAYVPTKDDVMVARYRTTGAQVTSFVKDGFNWNLVDVGGQHPERAKWQLIMEECRRTTAVLFFIALDEYNAFSPEDSDCGGGSCTRLELARRLFVQLLRDTLKDSTVVLFLNKYDVFVQKIKDDEHYADFKRVYPLYKGRQDPEECSKYVQARFVERAMEEAEVDMEVHGYDTCALDTNSVSNVFEAVKNDLYVARLNLTKGSLM